MSAAFVRWLVALLLGPAGIAFIRAIWHRWEGPVDDSIREQEEEP